MAELREEEQPPPVEEEAVVERSVISDDASSKAQNEETHNEETMDNVPQAVDAMVASSWEQQQQQLHYPAPHPFPPPQHQPFPFPAMPPPNHQAMAMAQYYEARMRDHAAAYASAAAGAAWAAAQIACSSNQGSALPPTLPPAPIFYGPPPPPYDPNLMNNPPPPPPHPMPHDSMMDNGNASEESHSYRPEKRHQSMPDEYNSEQDVSWHPPFAGSGMMPPYAAAGPPQEERTLWAPDNDQGTNSMQGEQNEGSTKRGRRRLRSAIESAGSSGGESRGGKRAGRSYYDSSSGYNKKQQKGSDDKLLSLIGKTGVSALHEYCSKKRLPPPNFSVVSSNGRDEFCMSVQVRNEELARGRAGIKGTAKQDAARRALQALIPGVLFDTNGLITQIPRDNEPAPTNTTLEELAPKLAARLAIAGNEEDDLNKKRHRGTNTLSSSRIAGSTPPTSKRRWAVYPGTSTTSEEEDENAYYASRGASVFSVLLHAMWQIREDIPDIPCYTYEVLKVQHNTPYGTSSASFACTVTLLLQNAATNQRQEQDREIREACTADESVQDSNGNQENNEEVNPPKEKEKTEGLSGEAANCREQTAEKLSVETLKAVGTGTTKREAKHVASAKMLTMLFPECSGMVEVKAAAEAAREEYAASKAIKLQKRVKANFTRIRYNRRRERRAAASPDTNMSFALPAASDPALPESLSEKLRSLLGSSTEQKEKAPSVVGSPTFGVADGIASVAALSLSEQPDSAPTTKSTQAPSLSEPEENRHALHESIARQTSRQKQLEDEVDSALQLMNELDETGKSLSTELTEDHVGRIVLRRANSDDVVWVQKLLARSQDASGGLSRSQQTKKSTSATVSPVSLLGPLPGSASELLSEGSGEVAMERPDHLPALMWASVSVVLLLCRAVALNDEPPLGCAVLTLGFSMEKGRLLRISEIAHETHLPEERFIECLETFSQNMKCSLERRESSRTSFQKRCLNSTGEGSVLLNRSQMKSIVEGHLGGNALATKLEAAEKRSDVSLLGRTSAKTRLQSVKEEDGEVEDERQTDSKVNKDRDSKKRHEKPNKRSRVA